MVEALSESGTDYTLNCSNQFFLGIGGIATLDNFLWGLNTGLTNNTVSSKVGRNIPSNHSTLTLHRVAQCLPITHSEMGRVWNFQGLLPLLQGALKKLPATFATA